MTYSSLDDAKDDAKARLRELVDGVDKSEDREAKLKVATDFLDLKGDIITKENIKKKYKTLALKYHPDKTSGKTTEEFKVLSALNDFLSIYEDDNNLKENFNELKEFNNKLIRGKQNNSENDEKARREAEEKARREAQEKARREAEEKARREGEEKARKEAEEKARKEAEEKAKREDGLFNEFKSNYDLLINTIEQKELPTYPGISEVQLRQTFDSFRKGEYKVFHKSQEIEFDKQVVAHFFKGTASDDLEQSAEYNRVEFDPIFCAYNQIYMKYELSHQPKNNDQNSRESVLSSKDNAINYLRKLSEELNKDLENKKNKFETDFKSFADNSNILYQGFVQNIANLNKSLSQIPSINPPKINWQEFFSQKNNPSRIKSKKSKDDTQINFFAEAPKSIDSWWNDVFGQSNESSKSTPKSENYQEQNARQNVAKIINNLGGAREKNTSSNPKAPISPPVQRGDRAQTTAPQLQRSASNIDSQPKDRQPKDRRVAFFGPKAKELKERLKKSDGGGNQGSGRSGNGRW